MRGKISVPAHSGELDVSPKDLNAIQNFFVNITPEFIKDGVGILDDNIRFIRWKNFVKITQEAEEIRKKHNLSVISLPLKTSLEYINSSSLEEDPTMQTMWANLLANMTSGKMNNKIIYVSILKELSPFEANILNKFFLVMKKNNFEKTFPVSMYKEELIKDSQEIEEDSETALDNLIRQRLLKQPEKQQAQLPSKWGGSMGGGGVTLSYSGGFGGSSSSDNKINEEARKILDYLEEDERNATMAANMFELTSLGFALLKACNEPK
jgi:hypothetical protein